ncbi:C-type lectin domain family 4 member A-like [Marmota monax]|uniref:C-type lectin domain family 4 member A-like n=1 Tax=Marmota monax TaxID=9995 RepID=UPI001EB00C07|nr:C-type lectin domain family 4 member A-like [Marmota monax]
MALGTYYAEVNFKNELKSSGTNSNSPADPRENTIPLQSNFGFSKLLLALLLILFLLKEILLSVSFITFFLKNSQLLKEKNYESSTKEMIHTNLECVKINSTMKGKVWSCCPKNWKSFSSSCYFISSKQRSWKESQENCSRMEAHLVVINSKEEQDFITWNLNKSHAYFVGLSDPEGQRHWQWIGQTPYNENTTFWHLGEPNRVQERCVVLNYRKQWGWNDIFCAHVQSSICEMMKIYL